MLLAEGPTVRVCGNRVQCTEGTVGKARVAGEERDRRAGCRGEGQRWLGPGHSVSEAKSNNAGLTPYRAARSWECSKQRCEFIVL